MALPTPAHKLQAGSLKKKKKSPHGAVVKHLADICTCGRTKVVGSNPTGVKVFKLRFMTHQVEFS